MNYITIQVEMVKKKRRINLCEVYRNHNFRDRAYVNKDKTELLEIVGGF